MVASFCYNLSNMTTFWREGHYRNGSWVDGHWVTRDEWDRFSLYSPAPQKSYKIEQTIFSSFTIPNATCPICGDHVFYYENIHGSKVWFDDLGPPWPIHGCFEKNNSSTAYPKSPIQNQKVNSLPQTSTTSLSLGSGILSLNRPQQNQASWISKVPCIIQKNIKRSGKSYVTAKVFDVFKQEKTVFLILDTSDISPKNHICFIQTHDLNNSEIFYFDIEKMEHGSIKATTVQNRRGFLFLAKYKQKNSDNIENIKNFIRKAKNLQSHTKIALADWLYTNTIFDNHSLSLFSGLNDFEINQLVNDKLKSTHIPQSPVSLGIIDDEAFHFLINNTKCVHTVL